jgi:menaquinol-cytochrome c reductase iron-sulfur subunit
MSDTRMPPHTGRRDFLLTLGAGAGAAAIAAQAGAAIRSLVPNLTYEPPTTVKVGPPLSFRDGLTFLPGERVFIVRDGRSFHAISAICTHLGCTVRAEALPDLVTHRFVCSCHGSRYSGDGANVSGPAPRPLAWYRLSLASDDGQLVAHLADEVGRGFRLVLP